MSTTEVPKKEETEEASGKSRSDARREDSELIRLALTGDEEAYRRLMIKYQPAIRNLICRMISDKTEVNDLTQETFVKAFGSLRSFNHVYAFSTWLYKIASNTCIDFLRKKKLQTFSIDQSYDQTDDGLGYELPDNTYLADKDLISDQRCEMVSDAIESLPEKYRKVIIMRHMEEKNYDEIAEALNIPLGTVKAHIFRGRELLYKLMKKRVWEY